MRYKGRIKAWKDNKGFGFITPLEGGDDLFLHISNFSSQDRRPAVGDLVTYQVTRDARNRNQAVDVLLSADKTSKHSHKHPQPTFITSLAHKLIFLTTLIVLAVYGYQRFSQHETAIAIDQKTPLITEATHRSNSSQQYSCAGKRYCSEMSSYEEALFYQQHCSGTQMDGDGDGKPCERQFSR